MENYRHIKKSGYFKKETDCKPITLIFFMMSVYCSVIKCALKHKLKTQKLILFIFNKLCLKIY